MLSSILPHPLQESETIGLLDDTETYRRIFRTGIARKDDKVPNPSGKTGLIINEERAVGTVRGNSHMSE